MIDISVIIPAYNCEKYIKKTVESVINQNHEGMQIVVINDGSTDKTLEILNEYKEKIKLISVHNQGVANARNLGISNADGKYIMFLDSDDYMQDDAISVIVCLFKKYNTDIIQFPMQRIYENGKTEKETRLFKNETFLEKRDFPKKIYKKIITGIRFNSLCRNVYKKELFENVEFKSDMKTAEDLMVNIDIFSKAKSYLYTDKIFYNYYIRNNGLTGNGLTVSEKIYCNKRVSEKIMTVLDVWNMNTAFYRFLTNRRVLIIAVKKIPKLLKQKLRRTGR